MIFVLFQAHSCDKTTIPTVTHAIQLLSEGTVRDDFTLPMGVTYACDEGYSFQNSSKYMIWCEYSKYTQNGQGDVTVRAQWSSSDGIICESGMSELLQTLGPPALALPSSNLE